jgi:mannitol/fructose-specific phosphotransferase system IIA component (Ntr-type)
VDFDAGQDSGVSVALGVLLPTDEGADLQKVVHALRQDAPIDDLREARSPEEAVVILNDQLHWGDNAEAGS